MARARGKMTARSMGRAAALLFATGLASCSLLMPQELRIIRWSPTTAQADPADIAVWVEFSAPVDATSAEQAFSFAEDGLPMRGRFEWEGNRLCFQPLKPYASGKDYVMSVTDSVEDLYGVSLDREFTFRFSTKSETSRPRILSVSPSEGASIDDRSAPIIVTFSERIDAVSFLHAFSLSPSVPGAITWSPDGETASFSPVAEYLWQTEYIVSVGSGASDTSGNSLDEARSWRFFVGTDRQPPLILEARNLETGIPGIVVLAEEDAVAPGLTITGGFECAWGIRLVFSEEVTRESLLGCLLLEPGGLVEITPALDRATAFHLTPAQRLDWDTLHTLTIRKGLLDSQGNHSSKEAVFHFRTDGPGSRPPRVSRVRFRGTPLAEPAQPVDFDPSIAFAALPIGADHFPVGVQLSSWFDIQVAFAEGAGLDVVSTLECFTIEQTGGCLSMRATALETTGFDDPQPEAIPGAVPLRFHVAIVNAAESGTVSLGFSRGFADSRGNPLPEAWRIPFLK